MKLTLKVRVGLLERSIEMLIQIRKTIEPPLAAGGGGVALLDQKGENITVKMSDKCRQRGSFLCSVTQVLKVYFVPYYIANGI